MRILLGIANVEMLWVDTFPIVATMKNPCAYRNVSMVEQVRHSMGLDLPATKPELPVSVTMESGLPLMTATLGFQYFARKSLVDVHAGYGLMTPCNFRLEHHMLPIQRIGMTTPSWLTGAFSSISSMSAS